MRTKNSIKNSIFGIGGQAINTLLSFISRTIFITMLGADYLGVNGLFSNILSMLSLAELGLGSAIIYNMYRPLAEGDERKLKALMSLYEKSYKIIGITIAIVGCLISPYLSYIIKDTPNIPNLIIIYLMFLMNSVVSYFYIYKSSIIMADQKNYIITVRQQIFTVLQVILQIVVLYITKNYLAYLLIQIICTFLMNFSISKKADKMYPFLKSKNKEKLDSNEKKIIFKHVSATMSHKVGGVVVNGTDNILMSKFVGVYWVGLYSNYYMIISIINRFVGQIFTAITASVGHLNVKESKEKSYDVYKKILFINFWIYGFCSISLLSLFNPFIKLWLGDKFLLSSGIVVLIVTNFYLTGMRQSTITYNSTLGLFWNDRYKPWIEACINMIASIILLKKLGISGVFLGTLISSVTTSVWVDPYILFKHGFNRNLSDYFKQYLKYMLITIISAVSTYKLNTLINGNSIGIFIVKCILTFIIPNLIFIVLTFKTDEFKYTKSMILGIVKRKSI